MKKRDLTEKSLENLLKKVKSSKRKLAIHPTTLRIPTEKQAQAAFEAGLAPYCPLEKGGK